MFYVLSLTVSGSLLIICVLLYRVIFKKHIFQAKKWILIVILLRLIIPLPGPLNLVGNVFEKIQEAVFMRYIMLEEDWLLDWREGRTIFIQEMDEIADAIPENAGQYLFGSYQLDSPSQLPIPIQIRILNPNTWLIGWGIGTIVCFGWSLYKYRKRSLCFKWFSLAVLSLHWFNPLMLLMRRALAGTPSAEYVKWNKCTIKEILLIAAIWLCLGALPGGFHTDLFWGANQFVFHLESDAILGKRAMDRFLEQTERGEPAFLRTVWHYSITPASSGQEWPSTETFGANYIWLYDIYYDGTLYHTFEPGAGYRDPYQRKTYQYLNCFEQNYSNWGTSSLSYTLEYVLSDVLAASKRELYDTGIGNYASKPCTIFSDFVYKYKD